jgi:mutator protein MutT
MVKVERSKVWLCVAGLVINHKGEWLVVQKRYGGLEGKWSFPAGFVEPGETMDQAVVREVQEETAIEIIVKGLIGFRTGVIRGDIRDNMAIFIYSTTHFEQILVPQLKEVYEARWMSPITLSQDPHVSVMVHEIAKKTLGAALQVNEGINPGDVFGYTSYKLFL